MQGMVTDIQRFSLNDGPGIRTTVFLKGCNMKCSWCHNPETIQKRKEIHYYEQNCIGCYKCVVACPCKAHKRIDGKHYYYPKLCVRCGKCTSICYAQAMVESGTLMTVADVIAEINQDIPYYRTSGGGVTISGGEVLCQPEFTAEIIRACQEQEIKTAIETNLSRPYTEVGDIFEAADLVIGDIKIFDANEHKRWTDLANERVLDNVKCLNEKGISFIVRTPLIPGITDTDENIKAIAGFLRGMKHLKYYELLNFNPLGDSKYVSLSRPNPFKEVRPLSAGRLKELKHLAGEQGIKVRTE